GIRDAYPAGTDAKLHESAATGVSSGIPAACPVIQATGNRFGQRPTTGDCRYGASINSIFPSRVRCRTITLPFGSRNTKTSRSRKWHSLIASSSVIGRKATASEDCVRCTSVVLATAGYLCTTTGTEVFSVRPTAI